MKTLSTFCLSTVCLLSLLPEAHADVVTKKMDLPYAEGQGVSRASETDNWGSCLPTERTLASNSVVEVELELSTIEKDSTIFCNRVGEADRTYTLMYVNGKGWRFDYNNSNAATYGGMPEANRRYTLRLSPKGLWVDGVKVLSKTPADFVIPTRLSLYCNYTYKESTQAYSYGSWGRGKAKIYSFKVYEPDSQGELTLAYELQPCLASTGKVGFYDTGTSAVYLPSSELSPLASTFTARAKDGAQGIVDALGLAKEAALNGSSIAYYGYRFNVAIEAGVYDLKGFEMASGSHLSVGIAKGGQIIGLGATPGDTVLLGGGETAAKRVVALGTMTLTNLTVTGGYVSSSDDGGGVKASSAGVGAVLGCIITNNYAKGSNANGGGGLWGVGTVRGCLIAGNRSTNGGGLRSCSKVVDCVISNNAAAHGAGMSGGSAWKCTFVDNDAMYNGGGVCSAVVTDCTLIGNQCYRGGNYGAGGGIYDCVATNCTFVGNGENNSVGGYGSVAAAARLVGCTVTNSLARRSLFDRCGAERTYIAHCGAKTSDSTYHFSVFGWSTETSQNSVVNTIIEDIACSNASDRIARAIRLVNCTIRNVTGCSRGTIDTASVAVNTIFANCSPYGLSATYCGTLTNCLYQTATGDFADGQLVNCRQVANVRWAQQGPTYDIRASSDAYNRGLEDDWVLGLVGETDYAGRPRKMFGALDIGAMECQDPTRPGFILLFR